MKKIVLAMLLIIFSSFCLGDTCFASTNETITFSCYTTTSLTKTIKITADSTVTVDWGDNNIEEQSAINGVYFSHSYLNSGVYEISITGDDISGFIASGNDIFEIDLTNVTLLKDIDIKNNQLSEVNFNNNLLLETVLVSDNNLNTLKIASSNLFELNCSNNNLTTLDIPNTVISLSFDNNLISSFDFSDFSSLKILTCDSNELTNLSLDDSLELKILNCSNNNIKSLSFQSNPKLMILNCYGNDLQEINLINNSNLELLNCFNNKLTSLDVTNNTSLGELYIFNNQISDINLGNMEVSIAIVDKSTNINNTNVQKLIYLESNKIREVQLYGMNVITFASEPNELLINGVQQVIEDRELDISQFSGINTISIIFAEDEEIVDVNAPQLTEGMIPVKYNGTNWVITNDKDSEWYNYNESNKKWANIMLRDDAYYLDLDGKTLKSVGDIELDILNGKEVPENYTGSMYVWIPRFTYKVSDTDIAIKYSQGITDYTEEGYNVHPAFNHSQYLGGNPNDEINYENLTSSDKYLGIWVAKFPAGKSISTPKFASNLTPITGNNIGDVFSASKLVETSLLYRVSGIKSHMMKNTEWGAVSYLTTAVGKLENSSTTGNIYGIFGMDTGAEYVSSFIELVGGVSNYSVRKNGKSLLPYNIISYNNYEVADEKDVEIYRLKSAVDNTNTNYEALTSFYGTGIDEVSTVISGNVTFNIPYGGNAFLSRGIDGIYSYSGVSGASSDNLGFRNSILVTEALANDNEKTYIIKATSTSGGKISPIGNTVLKSGSSITYSIIPDDGKELIDVLVDNMSVYSQLVNKTSYYTYQFDIVNSNHTIYAIFDDEIAEYNVTVIENPNGSGEIAGAGPAMSRSTVTLTANKKRGYKFSDWEIKEGLIATINKTSKTTSFRMPNNDVILQANFVEALKVSLTVENLYGSLIMEQFEENRIDVEATESENAKFINWTYTGLTLTESQEVSPKISFTMPANDVKLVANYVEV